MRSIQTNINSHTLEETTDCVAPGFPYRTDYCDVAALPGGAFPWHWHSEVEFFHIEQGAIEYHLTSGVYHFGEGDVGFVNSNVLHMTRAGLGAPSVQQEHIFLPRFISGERGSAVEAKYVHPLIWNRNAEILIFPAGGETAERMRERMNEASALFEDKPFGAEMRVRALMSEIWLLALLEAPAPENNASAVDDARIKMMLAFIGAHYAERLELEHIARSAHIEKRECCRCFKRQLNMTPFEYVIEFRIGKACEMLSSGDRSISAVSEGCGFANMSYFGKLFKEKIGCTPSAYRARRGNVPAGEQR